MPDGSSRCSPGWLPCRGRRTTTGRFEIKWDGVRALGFADRGDWRMQSRRFEDVTFRYPELAAIAEQLADRAAVLDGEVVALDRKGRPSFQLIQQRMGLASAAAVKSRVNETPVDYMIFDLLHLDGRSTRELPYPERRELLHSLGLEGPRWHTPATTSGAAPSCSRRRAARVSRGSSGSASTAPTARGSGPASGSRSGSGAARSS